MGSLLGISRRTKAHGPMETLEAAEVTPASGVEGDVRGKPGRRQITVLPVEGWRVACAEAGADLPWTVRRANLLVEGINPAGCVGHRIVIGTLVLEITGETDPCSKMEAAHKGLMAALLPDWRGGVTCRVRTAGQVRPGDEVSLLPPLSAT